MDVAKAESLIRYLKFVLSDSGHAPISYEVQRMSKSTNNSSHKLYVKARFSTWEARSHCINLLRKKGQYTPYSSDVDPVVLFLVDVGLSVTGWFLIHVSPASDPERGRIRKYVSHYTRSIAGVTRDYIPTPVILSFDIECHNHTGLAMPKSYRREDSIAMISAVYGRYKSESFESKIVVLRRFVPVSYQESSMVIIADDEKDMMNRFSEIVKVVDPDVIVGYNIFGFDFPYILDRMDLILERMPDISRIDGSYSTRVKDVDWQSAAYGLNVLKKVYAEGRVIMDVIQIFRRRKDLESVSLLEVTTKYLGTTKLGMPSEEMFSIFANPTQEGLDRVVEYCVKDSELVLLLVNRFDMWTSWAEESGITLVPIDDLHVRGTAIKVGNLLYKTCAEMGVAMKRTQRNWYKFRGAEVFEPKASRYLNCTCVDFRSLYPSIMIEYNICVSTYVKEGKQYDEDVFEIEADERIHRFRTHPKGCLPTLLTRLIEERIKVRGVMSACTNQVYRSILNERQDALKICANSVYGVLGFAESKYLSHVPASEAVTAVGRRCVTRLKKLIEHQGFSVVYGDTDSNYIHGGSRIGKEDFVRLTKDMVENINKEMPKNIKLAYEAHYDMILILTKKRYIMSSNGKITYKGVIGARRGSCKYAKKIYSDVLNHILEPSSTADSASKLIEGFYSRLLCGCVPLEDLVMTKSVKRDYIGPRVPQSVMIDRLKSKGIKVPPGTRLQYLFVDVPNTESQGDKMYTPEEVVAMSLRPDARYYIERQLSGPLEDLVEAIGYNNVEIYARSRSIGNMVKMM